MCGDWGDCTNRAFRCLTSEFKWDRVFSTKYGRDAVQPFSTAADSTRRFSRAVPHRGTHRAFLGPNRPNEAAVRRSKRHLACAVDPF